MVLNEENNNARFPFAVLLDEANLSPMEYYWAEFMRLTDIEERDSKIEERGRYINIGTEKDIYIPKTLKFLATINNDQTTEELSPRLIDRAWIIKLPNVEVKDIDKSQEEKIGNNPILWSDLNSLFNKPDDKMKSELVAMQ